MKFLRKALVMTMAIAILVSSLAFTALADNGEIVYGGATVTASILNIREGQGTDTDAIGKIPNSTVIVLLEKTSDDWYKINYHGTVGYVASRYLKDCDPIRNLSASGELTGDYVRLRARPNTDSDIIDVYRVGTEMTVIGINEGWYKVQVSGNTGYVRSDYFKVTGAASAVSSNSSSNSSSYSSDSSSSSSESTYTPDTNAALGQQIADYALQFVGYDYVYGAESPYDGFDCSGLVWYVYKQFGYSLNRRASQQWYHGYSVSKSEIQPGDLVFFSSDGYGITHIGIAIGNGQFVHASTSKTGVIISDLYSSYYTRVYWGARRLV